MQEQNTPTPVAPERSNVTEVRELDISGQTIEAPVVASPEKKMPATGDKVNQSGSVVQKPVLSLPTDASSASTSDDDDLIDLNSSPVTADDIDVIEKAWVQKAKSVVSETRTDPYNQEKKVSKLQADYQSKRFGELRTSEQV